MPIELPLLWVAVLNVVLWPVLQLGWAWLFTRMPAVWFHPPAPQVWEREVKIYQKWFRVRQWKDRLPDGAAWFEGGVGKKHLRGRDAQALSEFARETWRGELCHWVVIAMTPVFFLWNPWWADLVMAAYAVAANLPCVIAQRHNRARIAAMRAAGRGTV